MTCKTTRRTRSPSSRPLTWQLRKSCWASRRACLEIVTLVGSGTELGRQLPSCFFGQAALVLGCQNLAGHFARGLHDELTDLPFQLEQHAGMFGLGGLLRFLDDLLRG